MMKLAAAAAVLAAAAPSEAALDSLWTAMGGEGADELQLDDVLARLRAWAENDETGEAILFKDFWKQFS